MNEGIRREKKNRETNFNRTFKMFSLLCEIKIYLLAFKSAFGKMVMFKVIDDDEDWLMVMRVASILRRSLPGR